MTIHNIQSFCSDLVGKVTETPGKIRSASCFCLSKVVTTLSGAKKRSRTELFKSHTSEKAASQKGFSAKNRSHSLPHISGLCNDILRISTSLEISESEIDTFVENPEQFEEIKRSVILEETVEQKNSRTFEALFESKDKVKAIILRGLSEAERSEEVRNLFKRNPDKDCLIAHPNAEKVAYRIYYKTNNPQNFSILEIAPGKELTSILSDLKMKIQDSRCYTLTGAAKLPQNYSPIWKRLNKKEMSSVRALGKAFSKIPEKQVKEINFDAQDLNIEQLRQNFKNKLKTIVELGRKHSSSPGINDEDTIKLRVSYRFKYQLLATISWHLENSNLSDSQKNQIIVSLAVATRSCEKRFAEALSEAYQQITSLAFMPDTPPIEYYFDEWAESFKNSVMDKALSGSTVNHTGNIRYGVAERLKEKEGISVVKDLEFLTALSSPNDDFATQDFARQVEATCARFVQHFNPRDYAQHCCDSLNSLLKQSKGLPLECHIQVNLLTKLREYAARLLNTNVNTSTVGHLDAYLEEKKYITLDSMYTFQHVTLEGMYILLEEHGKITPTKICVESENDLGLPVEETGDKNIKRR